MTISQAQAENFINRTKQAYQTILASVKSIQAIAGENAQEVTAWGGGAAITDAIPDGSDPGQWDSLYPFTKAQFHDALTNLASCADVLASHGDLKPNLNRLRE
jgi:hypothetical protein